MWIHIRKYGFDGLDMNWKFSEFFDGSRVQQDRENFAILFKVFSVNWIEKKEFPAFVCVSYH